MKVRKENIERFVTQRERERERDRREREVKNTLDIS
jgi:hypothetical protein